MTDAGFANDRLAIDVQSALAEGGREIGIFRIEKWDLDQIDWVREKNVFTQFFDPAEEPDKRWFERWRVPPFEVIEDIDCNLITAVGWARCLNSGGWLGSAATLFSTTVGRIGLGIGSTAATYSDTNLTTQTGWTGNNWILCGVAPVYTAATGGTPATMVFAATFTTASYNASAVTEFCVDAGTASGTTVTAGANGPVNHGVNGGGYGTKTNSQTWNTTATLTFT
jgi:hypothetical protein